MGRDSYHWFLLECCEDNCLGFVSYNQTRFLERLINLDENVVPPEDIGLSTLLYRPGVEKETHDKHAQPGEIETVKKTMVLTDDVV